MSKIKNKLPDRVYELIERRSYCNKQICILKEEKKRINEEIIKVKLLAKGKRITTVKLYALQLENDCWYIGMSYNIKKRYSEHLKGKGAIWTKTNKPVTVHESRDTKLFRQDEAAKLEDDMTLEYALLYGSENVRGGGYCQSKPRWPDVIIQNELRT